MNKFEKKQYQAEVLNELYKVCKEKKRWIDSNYLKVGKGTKQSKNWRTGELEWEDEEKTIPKYEDIYDYVKKENLTDEEEGKIKTLDEIIGTLEKML